MRKIVLLSSIGFLSITILLIFLKDYQSRNELRNRKADVLSDMVILHSAYGGSFNISPEITLVDSLGKYIKLESILNEKPKLVYRFTDLDCETCIEYYLPIINSFSTKMGKKNVILFTSGTGSNYIRLFCRDHNLHFPIYNIPYNLINNGIEKVNYPYFFILTLNKQGIHTFIPNMESPELTQKYFNGIEYLLK